ncbi:MAG: ethylbenzene dehydrogenase-related protein [Candidatus Heimdallarchaeota archaeon]
MKIGNLVRILVISGTFFLVFFLVSLETATVTQSRNLISYYFPSKILLDGKAAEDFWYNADKLEVRKFDGTNMNLTVMTVHNSTHLFLFSTWTDVTESNTYNDWIFNSTKMWENLGGNEDRITFFWSNESNFPNCAHYTFNPNPSLGFLGDVWHWRASRTAPGGWTDDRFFDGLGRHSDAKTFGGYKENSVVVQMFGVNSSAEITSVLGNSTTVSSNESFTDRDRPFWDIQGSVIAWVNGVNTTNIGASIPGYLTTVPVGSRGDVLAGAVYSSGMWSVEEVRRLDTGSYKDDIKFEEGFTYNFSVAIHDNGGGGSHKKEAGFGFTVSASTPPTTTTSTTTTTTTNTTTTTTTTPTTTITSTTRTMDTKRATPSADLTSSTTSILPLLSPGFILPALTINLVIIVIYVRRR